VESNGAAPANVYAFSKVIMDNIARALLPSRRTDYRRARYFNVYGPCEAHKGRAASHGYHLAQQMKAGKRPRSIFKHGERNAMLFTSGTLLKAAFARSTPKTREFIIWDRPGRSFNRNS